MKNKIRALLKPDDESSGDLEEMLMKVIQQKAELEKASIDATEEEPDCNKDKEKVLHPGLVGHWHSGGRSQSVGVLLDMKTLQLYHKGRHGFVPSELPVPAEDWKLEDVITDYTYVTKRGNVFLQF